LNHVVALGAVALSRVEVVDLVASTLNPADSLVDIVELSCRALGAEVVYEIVSWFTDASVSDPVLIGCADGTADSIACLSTCLSVSIDAVTALELLVIDLSLGVADAANSSNKVVAR